MSECKSDCSNCGSDCPSKQDPSSLLKPLNENSKVGKVIAVVSGKGGVGKSMVTSLLAVLMRRKGYKVGVLMRTSPVPPFPRPSTSTRTPIRAPSASSPSNLRAA